MASRPLLIIPTYNEAQNLRPLIGTIETLGVDSLMDVLIVDDASPDGTGAVADEMVGDRPPEADARRGERSWMHVIHRAKKTGIGPAYIEGFRWGLGRGHPWLIQMDADFSHNPALLKTIHSLIQANQHDVLIGSRYTPGGGIRNWGLLRRWLSRLGNVYASHILSCPIRDLTGGFNAWRSQALEAIGLERIVSNGYSFQIELKYRAYKKGLRFTEFPILFEDRTQGRSKMSRAIVLEGFMTILRLRFSGPVKPSAAC